MNWFYIDNGQQAGPVDDAGLEELRRSGRIQPETMLWNEGMANWQPYREVRPEGGTAGVPQPPIAPPALGPNQVVCAECGRLFDRDSTIQFGAVRVCATCKPVFMQKLAEGATIDTGPLRYAGFWIRFGAVFVDGIIMQVVGLAIGLAFGQSITQSVGIEPDLSMGRALVLIVVKVVLALAYEVVMIGKFGATLGKMACKIQVVTAEGLPMSYLRSTGRYFGKIISALPCLIGYLMAGFDDQKRALHDRICNTRVVYK